MIERFVLLGLSHHTAPLPIRERMARLGDDLPSTLSSMKRLPGVAEGMVLATCNRVELYGSGLEPDQAAASLRDFIRSQGLEPPGSAHLYARQGEEAVRHLFRVAASLDSMVIGEPQILGQLKDAFQAASDAGATGDYLHRTVGRAFAVAKRVRTETEVGRNAVSMSYAAVVDKVHLRTGHLGERAGDDHAGKSAAGAEIDPDARLWRQWQELQ